MRSVVALLICCVVIFHGTLSFAEDSPQIPDLNWEPRADWINVKSSVQPGAVGDGVADDTAVIQSALNRIQDGATVYFPPGIYRITKTLVIPEGRFIGTSLLGHGRSTTLAWDGEAGGRMFYSNQGMPYARYVGLSWDGRGRAAVGVEHSCTKTFETEVRHQHEAYRNFTEAGIRVGKGTSIATAETCYDNCLFENCKHGISFFSFNVLDHTVSGSEFRNCGIGLSYAKGTNGYVRNCHFEKSSEMDVLMMGESGCSIRRCTSHGSKHFVTFGSGVGPLTIQDCAVDAWTDPEALIRLSGAPALIFDCKYTNPPSKASPVLLGHSAQRLVISNNTVPADLKLVQSNVGTVIEIPAGTRGGSIDSATRSFLKSNVKIAGKVFDAKRDFGAKGDHQADDTQAIAKTIEAARAHGNGAIAYLPPGHYVVSDTLRITGSDYFFGGSGARTSLTWRGKEGGTTVEIQDADRVTIENISVGWEGTETNTNAIDIRQVGTGKPSSLTYDRVWLFGMYQKKPLNRGLHLVNLGPQDRVHFREINGNLHFIDSARATAFLQLSYEGTILLEGKAPQRDGFIGGCVRLGTVTDPGLWIKDNHSLVMSDFYAEQSAQIIRMEGETSLPAGRVTLQGAKFEINKLEDNALEINNYHGELVLGPYQFYVGKPLHHFVQRGDAPFAMTLLASAFYNSRPDFQLQPSSKIGVVGIYYVGLNADQTVSAVSGSADTPLAEATAGVIHGLDDLRKLGEVDLTINYDGAP